MRILEETVFFAGWAAMGLRPATVKEALPLLVISTW